MHRLILTFCLLSSLLGAGLSFPAPAATEPLPTATPTASPDTGSASGSGSESGSAAETLSPPSDLPEQGVPVPAPEASSSPASVVPSPPAAKADDWYFSGQVLIRGEMDGRDFDSSTPPLFWTVMRTRLGVSKTFFERGLEFFVQLQDSRTFGEAGASIFNLKNIDLYQGYVQANRLLDQDLALQLGRFELDYGNGRLFNPLPGWNYLGQAFDGGRLKYRLPELFQLSLDAFAVTIKPTTPGIRNPTPAAYPLSEDPGHGIAGVWATAEFAPSAKVDAFGYYELKQAPSNPAQAEISRVTLGINHRGSYLDGLLSSSLEADWQGDSLGPLGLNAYLLSAAGFVHPGDFRFGLGVDLVSGTSPANSTSSTSFSQAFGNNHAFYGYMDYFINIPVNTKGLGLNDAYFKSAWLPQDLPLELALDLHWLSANQAAANGHSLFGFEADLTLTYKQGNNRYIWGLSGFVPGGLFSSDLFFGPGRNQPAFWSYLQAIVNF
ncbi:MAG: hypothetical protein CVV27_05215 [Candidatus Melainabacteria bacterium HGW-Melainabacteria-1]|nr:MAG: hypothetical protein CVV27_05215 [Candidatus Melainabacteria bacterium HGW-Melainabacteria-1]